MCNNFAYVIMLSAAEDILSVAEGSKARSQKTDDPCQVDKIQLLIIICSVICSWMVLQIYALQQNPL